MPKYGIQAFTLEGFWNNDPAPKVIGQAAELGFDMLEIPLLKPAELVLEAFAAINPDLIGATCLWRKSRYQGVELATKGWSFLKPGLRNLVCPNQ